MRRTLALVAGLAIAAPALAQLGAAPKPGVEAEAHIFSASTSRAEPPVMLEAGDVRLLLQYAPGERNVAFVEQLAGPAAAAPTPPQAPKSAPIVEVPLPTAPPPARPVAVQKPAAPAARAEKPRPRGECVIKPVMSEQDLWNCSAPGQASIPHIAVPAPVATQPAPPAPAAAPQRECVIKPVMSDGDLRACGARR